MDPLACMDVATEWKTNIQNCSVRKRKQPWPAWRPCCHDYVFHMLYQDLIRNLLKCTCVKHSQSNREACIPCWPWLLPLPGTTVPSKAPVTPQWLPFWVLCFHTSNVIHKRRHVRHGTHCLPAPVAAMMVGALSWISLSGYIIHLCPNHTIYELCTAFNTFFLNKLPASLLKNNCGLLQPPFTISAPECCQLYFVFS